MAVLVFTNSVLWATRDRPILEGFRLVQWIGQAERVILATPDKEERVQHQLRTERLQDLVADILDSTLDLPPLPLWQRQIEVARSKGPVSMVISGDPVVVEWAIERGLVSMLFSHPRFDGPPIRPVQGNRSWEQLMSELEVRP